ncbi:hypothetical protein GCM10017778_27500 [Streptomyces vinaceus]|nr:hypothetical protein GCM10017778_27500 [Streptomyces vinaceus]
MSPIPGRKRLTPGTPKAQARRLLEVTEPSTFSHRVGAPARPALRWTRTRGRSDAERAIQATPRPPANSDIRGDRAHSVLSGVGPNSWGEFDRSGIADWSIPNMADSLIPYQGARGESVNSDDPQMIKD